MRLHAVHDPTTTLEQENESVGMMSYDKTGPELFIVRVKCLTVFTHASRIEIQAAHGANQRDVDTTVANIKLNRADGEELQGWKA